MALVNRWLDESTTDPSEFEPLLQPYIPYDLIAQQIDKPSTYNYLDMSSFITKD
ncbi:hypothetical protein RNAN_3564 [Rheinheimera nanhaiensis E407-8]|uniref:Uncharacterized protein n=1 Tax=Rheinheimera nanhaiensis E407-8 TaxID=562729 RepID=I1E2L1_9GAMM|nr:hypothetical protein RNAN_3564 [Rheinheimera nanhaiensis E407-8]